jgi:hypothetical protein
MQIDFPYHWSSKVHVTSLPEFKKILREVYASGQPRDSGEALQMAWVEFRKKHHGGTVTVQQRRYAQRKSFENPRPKLSLAPKPGKVIKVKCPICRRLLAPGEGSHFHNPADGFKNDFYIVFETDSNKPIKEFQRLANARKFASRMMAKHGVGSYYIQRYSDWHKKNPGSKWHLAKATVAHQKAKAAPDKEERDHQVGHFEAHLESAEVSRKDGINPIAIYNPPKGKPLPMAVIEIRYKRTSGDHAGQLFKHHFKVKPRVFGLSDGSILIKGNQRLWGTA